MSWAFDEYELDPAALELRHHGDVVPMEPQVFQVLVHLVEHADRVVTKAELLDAVWGTSFVSESALTTRIKSARQAVGDDGKAQRVIRTFHGRGYRFVSPVTSTHGGAGQPLLDDPVAADRLLRRAVLPLAVDCEFPFVGRVDVMAEADRLADLAAVGPQALLLGGEPGLGKSRLAVELATRLAEREGVVATAGRCEQHLASSLQPWLEATNNYIATAPTDQVRADTAGLVDRLCPVLPDLAGRLGIDAPDATVLVDEFAIVDGLVALVERASRREVIVIVLDDVQWAGGATRSLASLLLRRGVARVLLVMTFRTTSDDLGAVTAEWLIGLERAGASREDLDGLTFDDVEELVGATLGAVAARDVGIWERSGGHSLFAVELIRDAVDGEAAQSLPSSVASLVRGRIERLPDTVANLVTTAAALGQEFDLDVVAAVAEMDEYVAIDAVEGAMGAQLLHEVPDRVDWFRFSHQLVPAATLDSMSTSRRVRLHAKVASELESRSASEIEIAHHLLEASAILDRTEVVERVRRVSESALTMHQYDRAVELLERAARLSVDPRLRAEVLTEFGAACNLAGQQPRALEGLRQAANVARKNGWDDLLAAAALGMWGQSPFRASQDRTVIPLLDESIARSDGLDAPTRARLLAKRAAFNLFSGPFAERDSLSATALELVGPDASPARLEVLEARWMAIASPAQLESMVELDAELEILRKELGALSTDACAPEISIYARGLGPELRALATELRDDPRQRRDVDQWRTITLDGTFALFDGDVSTARACTDRALPLGEQPWGEAGQVVHALVHLLIDVLGGASTTAVERWQRIGELVPSDAMRATRAWAEARFGDRAEAERLFEHVLPRVELLANNFMGGFGLVGLGEAAILLDRVDDAPAVLAVLEPLSGRMMGHPWAPAFAADDVAARLHLLTGDAPAASAAADRARLLYEHLGATSFMVRLDREIG